jgi:hypothetical protein
VPNDLMVKVGKGDLGATILTTVIISTVFSEALGSYGTKIAITRAGEVGKARPDRDPAHTRHTHELDMGDEDDDTSRMFLSKEFSVILSSFEKGKSEERKE